MISATPFPVYQPAMRIIDDITNDYPALVTTTFAHQYQSGLILRLNTPPGYGMQEANQLYARIVVTSSTQFEIYIDTTSFSDFSVAGSFPESYQSAMTTPVGNINESIYLAVRNVLPYGAA